MSSCSTRALQGAMGSLLYLEDFYALAEKLYKWRVHPVINTMEREKDKGRILGFVKGLRLSAEIAYIIRSILSSEDVEVNWGHLLDKKGESCSPECDIIIHRRGHIQQWDGGEKPIMDFRFIECSQALAVISCKSYARSIDKKYCEYFSKYNLKNILLFAECCTPSSVERLKEQAKERGYKGFYYLYTIDKNGVIAQDERMYIDFIENIKKIATSKT